MKVDALFAGKPQPFGPRGAPSAIKKIPVSAMTVYTDHTAEDEQGNKKLHGGAEKVLHQYANESYDRLREAYPDIAFPVGSIGENIIVDEMSDTSVYVGDVYRFGEVILQVSAPRAPCNKISHQFNVKNLDRFVGNEGITGWYYRVIQTGRFHVGDEVELIERAADTVCICDLMRAVYADGIKEWAATFADLTVVDSEWREKCRRVVKRKGTA